MSKKILKEIIMKIVIITNPNRDLKETGFGSIQSCKHVLESVVRMGYDAIIQVCQTEYDLNLIVKSKPDLVILAVKYLVDENSKEIWLADFFYSRGINFTGSFKNVLKFDSNKVSAKKMLRESGIRTAEFFTALPKEFKTESELPLKFPLFLKPSDAANGNGIDDNSLVFDFESYEKKILALYEAFDQPVLVEEYLDGREFTVAIIENKDSSLKAFAVEIIPPETTKGLRILGARTKYENSEVLLKIQDQYLNEEIKDLAISSFQKLGGRDFGRIDIRLNNDDECYFMEANLVPGMTASSSYFPRACHLDSDIEYDEVIELVISQGINRVPVKVLS
jgi:D-alanine-D-alanine ligase